MTSARTITLLRTCLAAVVFCATAPAPPVRADAEQDAAMNLAALYELALVNDAGFQAGIEKHKAAALQPGISRANLLPKVELRANRRRIDDRKIRGRFFGQDASGSGPNEFSYNVDNYSLSIRQPLFRREYYIELAQSKSGAQRAALELEAARQDLIIRLAEAYFGVLSAQANLDFTRAEQDAVKKQLERAQQRFEVGLNTITDSKKAEAAHDLATAELIKVRNTLRIRKMDLHTIVKRRVERIAPLSERMQAVKPAPAEMGAWVQTALQENLALLIQRLNVNIAADEIKRQRAGHLPSIDLYARRDEDDIKGGPSPQTRRGNEYGVEITVPLFSGGGVRYRSEQAAHRYNSSFQQLEQTRREIERNMSEAYLNVVAGINRIEAFTRAQESAQVSYQSNQQGFEVGNLSSVDVLLAIEALFEARRNYSDTRHQYILDTLRMKRAAGQLSDADVQRINKWLE